MSSDTADNSRKAVTASWSNFKTERELLISVIGYNYGPEPETRMNDIRRDRKIHAERIMHFLDINENDVVVDFGSGVGFIAEWIAPRAQKVFCLDIGQHHIDYTRNYLRAHANVECHLIEYANLSSLIGRGVTKFYASAVFIHFCLWDIAIHLRRIHEIIAPRGKAYVNIMNSDGLDVMSQPLFATQLAQYERVLSPIYLVTWNSGSAVKSIAEHIGFSVESVWVAPEGNTGMLFSR